jgi:hypothetical protein
MRNVFEKRDLICLNKPNFILQTYFCTSQKLFKPIVYGKVNHNVYRLPLIKNLENWDNKFSQICIFNYQIYNKFDKTFIVFYNSVLNQKFIHQIDNNNLLLPLEIPVTVTILDLEWNEFNYSTSICIIPGINEGSWYDVAEGSISIPVKVTIYDISFNRDSKLYTCMTFIGSFFHQIQNNNLILKGVHSNSLFVWSSIMRDYEDFCKPLLLMEDSFSSKLKQPIYFYNQHEPPFNLFIDPEKVEKENQKMEKLPKTECEPEPEPEFEIQPYINKEPEIRTAPRQETTFQKYTTQANISVKRENPFKLISLQIGESVQQVLEIVPEIVKTVPEIEHPVVALEQVVEEKQEVKPNIINYFVNDGFFQYEQPNLTNFSQWTVPKRNLEQGIRLQRQNKYSAKRKISIY